MWQNKNNNLVNRKFRSKGKLRYSAKKYSNPFFSSPKRSGVKSITHEFSVRAKFILLTIFLALALFVWCLFYSPLFVIKNINVQGGGRVLPGNVEKIAWQQIEDNFLILFPQKNIFFFNQDRLIKSLEKKYFFDALSVKKKFPHTLIIQYEEKKYSIIWHEGDKYYYADENGLMVSEANLLEIEQKDYPLVDNLTEFKISNHETLVEQSYLDYVVNLFEKFKEYSDDFVVERYVLDSDINTVKAILKTGPTIYFNINEDLEKQINKLLVIKREKLKDDFNGKTYINLKYGDRVYYR